MIGAQAPDSQQDLGWELDPIFGGERLLGAGFCQKNRSSQAAVEGRQIAGWERSAPCSTSARLLILLHCPVAEPTRKFAAAASSDHPAQKHSVHSSAVSSKPVARRPPQVQQPVDLLQRPYRRQVSIRAEVQIPAVSRIEVAVARKHAAPGHPAPRLCMRRRAQNLFHDFVARRSVGRRDRPSR